MSETAVTLLVGAALGGLASWLVTHVYHLKASRDLRRVVDRLPDVVREAVQESTLDKLTVDDLNDALRARVVDATRASGFPYKACPRCGSQDLAITKQFHSAEPDSDEDGNINWSPINCATISCMSCGWSENEIDGARPVYLSDE
ncbi:MAG: hypothetical protein NTV92_07015 [Candidatus Bipolaricaulota bacterium]|nr:hypothetical protein [Candidatus Bipolaricaulota bacterium]